MEIKRDFFYTNYINVSILNDNEELNIHFDRTVPAILEIGENVESEILPGVCVTMTLACAKKLKKLLGLMIEGEEKRLIESDQQEEQ